MSEENLGQPLTGIYAVDGSQARVFERGATIKGPLGDLVVAFKLPTIGVPHIAAGTAERATALAPGAFSFRTKARNIETIGALIDKAFSERVALLPTGEPPQAPVRMALGKPAVLDGDDPEKLYSLPVTAPLKERQLYDVAVRGDDGTWTATAPNAIYFRSSWHDFGLAHITDIHLARRIDGFPALLEHLGRREAAQRMYNWNDRFRGFIRYANYLHRIGVLDVVLATGDIIDYIFENDDDRNGGGNAAFAREILLGKWPTAGFEDVGPLRVPIFMIAGNHDYRKNPYRLLFNLDIGLPWNVKQLANFSGYNLPWTDGLAISRRDNGDEVPELSAATAAEAVDVDKASPFSTYLADRHSYVVELGEHRIVMLDSGWDVGVATDKIDGLKAWLGWAEEDERTFVGGSPNSEGVSAQELALLARTLEEAPAGGLVVVGLHAPLFDSWAERYPWYLRETQRPQLAHHTVGHVCLLDPPAAGGVPAEHARKHHPSWFGPAGAPEPAYVKRGDTDDFFDYGVSRGAAVDALKLIAGIGARRAADVVLHGHVHRFNEFRLENVNGELAYFMDFYTHNPARYYPTRFPKPVPPLGFQSDVAYVEVVDGAPANGEPTPMPNDATYKHVVQVPPYPKPLATATDARAWWSEHRPLVLQCEAYGPLKDREVSFAGFRVLSVKNDVIDKIHLVRTQRLHESGYQLPWEDAIKPDSTARRYQHVQRSREHNSPEAAGVPHGYLPPTGGFQNIVYRDAQGRLIELWRDGNGATGTGNLTHAAHNAPGASGDPYVYVEASTRTQIVLYRGFDGHVNSLYWSTGDVGYDHLSSSVGAPKAVGNPTGYFEAATNTNHVAYRKEGGNLHELWWTGQGAVDHADITAQSPGALKANGDPSTMLDTARGDHIVLYRATDGHIHSLYWSTGPIGHENLSGFARAPKAAGDPHAYYTPHNDMKQIVYRGIDKQIHELWWGGTDAVKHGALSAAAGAPPAASDAVSFYSEHTQSKHVFYTATNGHVIELWWHLTGTPAWVDLTAEALAPPAVGKPGAFANGPYRHVVFRGSDNQIHEIRFA
jgi:hypothetical protein